MIDISKKACYKTVKGYAEDMIVEKKSKFIASVSPVASEGEALEFLKEIKSKYPDANHHVYAYVIDENNIFRYSDDAEPGGTAGMPVLDAVRKEGLVDVCVVVTRYFGGVLLGTGGLVHAYGSAAKKGLEAAIPVKKALCNIVAITVDYSMVGKLQHKIASDGLILEDTVYSQDVVFYVGCKIDDTQRLFDEITDITNGKCSLCITDSKYVNIEL